METLSSMEAKLTAANLEHQQLRSQLDGRAKDLAYTTFTHGSTLATDRNSGITLD